MEKEIEKNHSPIIGEWLQNLSKTAGTILTFFTLIGCGFTIGKVFTDMQSQVEKLELKIEYDKELKDSEKKKDEIINELREELREYKIEYKFLKNKNA